MLIVIFLLNIWILASACHMSGGAETALQKWGGGASHKLPKYDITHSLSMWCQCAIIFFQVEEGGQSMYNLKTVRLRRGEHSHNSALVFTYYSPF